MSSEAITRNDLQAILSATVGSTYMEQQITTFSSGWAVYGDDTPVTVRRFGRVVSLSGALKNTTSVTLNTTDVTVFTLPEGYRPSQTLHSINESTNNGIFLMRVQPSGAVQFARWRINTTTFPSVASGYWFPFHITYITDDLAVNEALPALMGDYVVEQGTIGKWYYEKYESGLLKGWYFDNDTTTTLTTNSGNGWYRNANPYSISMSGLGLVGVPRYASITVNCGLAHVFASVSSLSSTAIQYYVSHLGTYSNRTSDIHATVVGRWKEF